MYTVAIGDIHGCLKELKDLMDCTRRFTFVDKETRYIFLGDYVDRGPDSKGVLDFLMKFQEETPNVVCLLGNHEDNMLNCYYGGQNGEENYQYNHSIGGSATLNSFGVIRPAEVPLKYINWIGKLPLYVIETNEAWRKEKSSDLWTDASERVYVHAGIDRKRPMDQQSRNVLIWDRTLVHEPIKGTMDTRFIVHGHTPVGNPTMTPHRLNIDTGCVFGFEQEMLPNNQLVVKGETNRSLTAAIFDQSRVKPVKLVNHRGTWIDIP